MFELKDEPFELIMYLRNLPKIASSIEIIECARLLRLAVPLEGTRLATKKNQLYVGMRFWIVVIAFHFIYYMLSITIFPKLKQF